MQPSEPLNADIKTLADWVYDQFRATDPVEVKNVLDSKYHFKYCVGENIETPDQVSRRVVDRQYEEFDFEPGEQKVLMGAAAYIFVDGVARQYLYYKVLRDSSTPIADGGRGLDQTKAEEAAANATADVQQLVEAAKLAIVGKVGYAKSSAPAAVPTQPHNPNVVNDNSGNLPAQTTGSDASGENKQNAPDPSTPAGEADAFANTPTAPAGLLKLVPATEADDGKAHFYIGDKEVTADEYNAAQNG